jgi:SH3 domain protein
MPACRHLLSFKISLTLFQLFAILLLSRDVVAETKYVSDVLVINIRSSIEAPYSVVDSVYSDEPLKILRTDEKYYFVETENGKQGWISKQYVKDTVPKSLLIKQLRSEKDDITESLNSTKLELQELRDKFAAIPSSGEAERIIDERNKLREQIVELKKQVATLLATPNIKAGQELAKMKEEYTTLTAEKNQQEEANQQTIKELKATVSKLQDKKGAESAAISQLKEENLALRKKTNVYWFLAGSGVFLIGIITGKILNPRKKKRSLY